MLSEDTRLKVATESTSKTVVNTTTTPTTTTTSSTPTTTTDSETASGSEVAAQNRIINDPFWGKRPPERIGSGSANDGFFVEDKSEVKLNLNTYKMVFVMNKDVLFYKKNSLRKAKQVSGGFLFIRFLSNE